MWGRLESKWGRLKCVVIYLKRLNIHLETMIKYSYIKNNIILFLNFDQKHHPNLLKTPVFLHLITHEFK